MKLYFRNIVFPFLRSKVLKKIPILSDLFLVRWEAHQSAFKQVSIVTILSTLPVWLTGTLTAAISRARNSDAAAETGSVFHSMVETVSQGELFMLAVATVAPLFYLSSQVLEKPLQSGTAAGGDSRSVWPFPFRDIHRFFVTLFVLVAAVFFFVMRREQIASAPSVIDLSLLFYVASLFLLYAATANVEARSTFASAPMSDAAEQADDFADAYASHRERT